VSDAFDGSGTADGTARPASFAAHICLTFIRAMFDASDGIRRTTPPQSNPPNSCWMQRVLPQYVAASAKRVDDPPFCHARAKNASKGVTVQFNRASRVAPPIGTSKQ
jgi:hypothetical protein